MAFGSVVNIMNLKYPRDKTEAQSCKCTFHMPTEATGNVMILDTQYTSNRIPTECPVTLDLPIKHKCIKSNHMHKSNMSFTANPNQIGLTMYETPLTIRRHPQATTNMRIWLQVTGINTCNKCFLIFLLKNRIILINTDKKRMTIMHISHSELKCNALN